ncbi:hypothetical protein KRR26_06300 [Corallococcus sp. M34]|uniref:FlgO family outer membrane protein n=1 Tax=Citreicoccus inhibens TaxID=2849499 RepID=UPI001C21B078|nr:FlgO family outer membrane protein [Citreicoccus inhibens]MBU8895207.1 hypothetical protein [Citreicoccus inhibens]
MKPVACALLMLSLTVAAEPAPPPLSPVAVMPFRNLNGDTDLDWLGRGMTETLVSDLRASGRVDVVEREQLDHALTELALQTRDEPAPSTAARVGKLVGARTVLLGSVQRAGPQVRINARFIVVETGEVLETAKVTGPMERIFSLQDQVVARLMGTSAPPRGKRPTGPRIARAFERYGRALGSTSDEERLRLLREAQSEAPELPYAREEMARVAGRIAEFEQGNRPRLQLQAAELRTRVSDTNLTSLQRSEAAIDLIHFQLLRGSWRAAVRDTEQIRKLDLPFFQGRLPAEEAAFAHVLALSHLTDPTAAMKDGEAFLRDWPATSHTQLVTATLRSLAIARNLREQGIRATLQRMEEAERSHAEALVQLQRLGWSNTLELRGRDYDRCMLATSDGTYEFAVEPCRRYYLTWNTAPHEDRQLTRITRSLEIIALVGLRRFSEARARMAEFRAADPEGAAGSTAEQRLLVLLPEDEEE